MTTTTTRGLAALVLGLTTAAALVAPQASAAPTAAVAPGVAPVAVSASLSTSTHKSWASAVLVQLNAERAAHGLAPLHRSKKLVASAHKHNLAMAKKDTLSHQLPGEKSLGKRVTAAKYTWSTCGENIGWNSDRSKDGVLALETAMYSEVPPNDGHRRNILSASFTDVGIDVVEDKTHGKVWLTTDFGHPR